MKSANCKGIDKQDRPASCPGRLPGIQAGRQVSRVSADSSSSSSRVGSELRAGGRATTCRSLGSRMLTAAVAGCDQAAVQKRKLKYADTKPRVLNFGAIFGYGFA